jgi:hypothetical protein
MSEAISGPDRRYECDEPAIRERSISRIGLLTPTAQPRLHTAPVWAGRPARSSAPPTRSRSPRRLISRDGRPIPLIWRVKWTITAPGCGADFVQKGSFTRVSLQFPQFFIAAKTGILISAKQAAKRLGISPNCVRGHIAARKTHSVQSRSIGKTRRENMEDFIGEIDNVS